MAEVVIVPWQDRYHRDFIALSMEWLEQYACLEPADMEILNDPWKTILDGGGEVFFALHGETLVGAAAMIRQSAGTFELAKLGVTARCKGLKIGRRLLERCMEFARAHGAKSVILYTNKKLEAAIALYRKFGFAEIPLEDGKYETSDMKMELRL